MLIRHVAHVPYPVVAFVCVCLVKRLVRACGGLDVVCIVAAGANTDRISDGRRLLPGALSTEQEKFSRLSSRHAGEKSSTRTNFVHLHKS